MKLLTADQIRACDAFTIQTEQMHAIDLMERAAVQCAEWLMQHFPKDALFVILCGVGNNGGDGLAITRILHRNGYGVKAFLLQFSKELSKDCHTNLQRLERMDSGLVTRVPQDTFITDIPSHLIIIDAILGSGLNRPPEGWLSLFIQHINQLPNTKIAIDIPSGLPADNIPEVQSSVIKAAHTLSFQFYKRSFLHEEGGVYTGKVHLLDIGLSTSFIEASPTHYYTLDIEKLKSIYQPRTPFSHKGTYGTAVIAAGSYGMMGAAVLSARAAGRAGAGKVKGIIPGAGYEVFQCTVPEAMCVANGANHLIEITAEDEDAVGIGPGLGIQQDTARALEDFLDRRKTPVVLDADALNILSNKKELLHKIPAGSILTPHPKEFKRLFGDTPNSMLQVEHARTQAMRYNFFIVLKNHYTTIVTPDGECWYNLSGTAALATGGSGDVLTGIITALLAQNYEPEGAALLGVYLHGRAGKMASEQSSIESVIANDISEYIGAAFRELY